MTWKICKEYTLYKFKINSKPFHVYSFAIQWFSFCKNRLHVLRASTLPLLNFQLQSSEVSGFVPIYCSHLAVCQQLSRIPTHRRLDLGSTRLSKAQNSMSSSTLPQLPVQRPLCSPAWDSAPAAPLFNHSTLWLNVWTTARFLPPAGFPGIWIKVKIANKEGEEKWQAETCKEKEDKVQKIGSRLLGRGWGYDELILPSSGFTTLGEKY